MLRTDYCSAGIVRRFHIRGQIAVYSGRPGTNPEPSARSAPFASKRPRGLMCDKSQEAALWPPGGCPGAGIAAAGSRSAFFLSAGRLFAACPVTPAWPQSSHPLKSCAVSPTRGKETSAAWQAAIWPGAGSKARPDKAASAKESVPFADLTCCARTCA